jgi:hypothetical protein
MLVDVEGREVHILGRAFCSSYHAAGVVILTLLVGRQRHKKGPQKDCGFYRERGGETNEGERNEMRLGL